MPEYKWKSFFPLHEKLMNLGFAIFFNFGSLLGLQVLLITDGEKKLGEFLLFLQQFRQPLILILDSSFVEVRIDHY